MNSTELGKKLKSARIAKKMTQSEVVGDFITRNMLSQIESGSATPSMKTLEYLAGVLEIPMERLVSDQEDYSAAPVTAMLSEIKKLLKEESYAEILEYEDSTGMLGDEFHAIRSIAMLRLAEELSETRNIESMQQALYYAKNAVQESMLGIYANESRCMQAQALITKVAQFLSNYYSDLASCAGSAPAYRR